MEGLAIASVEGDDALRTGVDARRVGGVDRRAELERADADALVWRTCASADFGITRTGMVVVKRSARL
ncbi:MAG: hypothetical protein CFE32_18960, partial [Alphaproteobacteria bacterium PA3]